MSTLRLPQLILRLALLGLLVFAAFASASWAEDCGAASPCANCSPISTCQTALSANACCALGAASLLPATLPLQIAPGAVADIKVAAPARLIGRSFAPPLPPPRSL